MVREVAKGYLSTPQPAGRPTLQLSWTQTQEGVYGSLPWNRTFRYGPIVRRGKKERKMHMEEKVWSY